MESLSIALSFPRKRERLVRIEDSGLNAGPEV
jgi:hypothetical protein